MSFDARDLRPGKDVFDADGAYLGTVVWLESATVDSLPLSCAREMMSAKPPQCRVAVLW